MGDDTNLADVEAGQQQTGENKDKLKDNPYVVNPNNLGGVKLMVPDDDFIPKPFKTIKQVIMVSYVCYLFLIFPGAIANQYAWEALKYKELGARSEAKAMARSAVCWIWVGFAIGAICILGATIAIIVEFA